MRAQLVRDVLSADDDGPDLVEIDLESGLYGRAFEYAIEILWQFGEGRNKAGSREVVARSPALEAVEHGGFGLLLIGLEIVVLYLGCGDELHAVLGIFGAHGP
jgi:hypothetical protein